MRVNYMTQDNTISDKTKELKKKISLIEWDLQNIRDENLKLWKIQELESLKKKLSSSSFNKREVIGDAC